MTAGETLGPDVAPEQLEIITECWRNAASELVSARGQEAFLQAQREYVLTILARVEWEEARTGEVFEGAYKAERWNGLYNEGIDRVLLDGRRHWYHVPKEHGHGIWQRYLDTQIYPRINVKRGVAMPQGFCEALEYLRNGQAEWQESRPRPRAYSRSA